MRNRHVGRRRSGFTLIELLVVIIILAILAAVVIPRVIGRTEDAKVSAAISTVQSFNSALEMYKLDHGSYPSNDQGLTALISKADPSDAKWNGPYLKNMDKIPLDPWGHPYSYKTPGDNGRDYDIVSQGGNDGHPIQSWNPTGS